MRHKKIYVVELFGEDNFYHYEEVWKVTPKQILEAVEDGCWGKYDAYFNEQISYYERVYGIKPEIRITYYKDFDYKELRKAHCFSCGSFRHSAYIAT